MPLIGRESETRELGAWIAGEGWEPEGPIVLTGHAGIGKTALWEYAVDLARSRGFVVCTHTATRAERSLARVGLADLLGDLPMSHAQAFEALPDRQRRAIELALVHTGERADQHAVAAGTTTLLRAVVATAPVLVAVDDLQWLDAASACALTYAARRLAGTGVRFLLARRPGEQGEAGPERLSGVRRIDVGPLTEPEVRRLLEDRLDLVLPRPRLRRLYALTAGHPAYVLELGRSWHADPSRSTMLSPPIPETLHDVATAHLDLLSAPAREAIEVASLLAAPTPDFVAHVLEDECDRSKVFDGLVEAERAGLVTVHETDLVFAHPLVGAAVRAGVPGLQRRRLHARIAALIDDERERPWHRAFAAHGPDERAAEALERSASGAPPPEAAARLDQAARSTPSGRRSDRHRRWLAAGHAQLRSGDLGQASDRYATAAAQVRDGPDRARALYALGVARTRTGHLADGSAILAEALDQCGDDDGLRATVLVELARSSRFRDVRVAESYARAAVVATESLDGGHPVRDDAAQVSASIRIITGRPIDGMAAALRATTVIDDPVRRRPALLYGEILTWSDELDAARGLYERLLAFATNEADESLAARAHLGLAAVAWRAGEWTDASDRAGVALDAATLAGERRLRGESLAVLASVAAGRGELDAAQAYAAQGIELGESTGDSLVVLRNRHALGLTALTMGDDASAFAHLWRVREKALEIGIADPGVVPYHGDLLEAAVLAGELRASERVLAALAATGDGRGRPRVAVIAARGRAQLALARGEVDAAAAACDQAIDAHKDVESPFERARSLLLKGSVLRRRKSRRAAQEVLNEARDLFAALPAAPWSERVERELLRIGGRPRTAFEPTETELQIATLAGRGLTNRQVADRLCVSLRTVESNLTRVYRKLGVSSRTQLAHRLIGVVSTDSEDT